jgi:hypothetical protein
MGCSLMRPTHNKNFMILLLASSIHDMAKSRFSQSATYGAERRSKIIESAKRHDMTIIPPKDEKPSINRYRYGYMVRK